MDPASSSSSSRQPHHSPSPSSGVGAVAGGGGGLQRSADDWEGGLRRAADHHSSGEACKTSPVVLPTNSPMPTNPDPVKWTREEVHSWLRWCQEEFSLDNVHADKFSMNGKALCLMPKQAFRDRAPDCGDVLYELLQRLFRRECRFYHSNSDPDSAHQRNYPESQSYCSTGSNNSNRSGGGVEHQTVPRSPTGQGNYHSNLALSASNSSPRLPMDLSSQPEKSNTPCSDSGHSSPDMAEDLRLAATSKASVPTHYRRHNAPPMITLTSPNQRMLDKTHAMRMVVGKNLHDAQGEQMEASVPPSPTKRFRPDYSQTQSQSQSSVYSHMNLGHIELRHRANTAEGLSREQTSTHQATPSGLHPFTAARLLGRRRLSSDESITANRAPSTVYAADRNSTGTMIGLAAAYQANGTSAIPVPCSSLAAGSAILSRLQQRRNSTGGAEGIRENYTPHPQHSVPISAMPRRRSMDLDEVFLLDDETFETRKAAGGDCRLLWDFLVQLLKNKTYMPYIRWEDRRERVFRILDPVQIANLWGLQKNRTNMTYEKLSRALRYYYKMGILQKEQGQKLTYRFLQDPKDIANSQRFSKIARSKETSDHPEVPGAAASSSPMHLFPSSSSSSPPITSSSSSPSTMGASLPSSTSTATISTSSERLSQSRVFSQSAGVATAADLYQYHHMQQASDDLGQRSSNKRSSAHLTSTSSTPSPPVPLDDPIALATHQSMEGVSMMALTSPWQQGSNSEGQRLRVKEEPQSPSRSPDMES